jgi:hypothetical protein
MSEVRLGATGLLVLAVLRNWHLRQAQMQGMQWKGDKHILPQCSLAHAEAFSNLEELRSGGSLRAARRSSPALCQRLTAHKRLPRVRSHKRIGERQGRGSLCCEIFISDWRASGQGLAALRDYALA